PPPSSSRSDDFFLPRPVLRERVGRGPFPLYSKRHFAKIPASPDVKGPRHMRRYSTSPYRIAFLAIMLLAVIVISTTGRAQSTSPAPAATPANDVPATNDAVRMNLVELVKGHLDFVFYTIFALSIIGLALIINGFIRNWNLIPEQPIERMKNLIEQRRYRELQEFTARDRSFVSRALHPAL